MKKGWKTKRLDEVCDFTNGLWKGEKPPFLPVGVIRNTNFTRDGTLDDSDIAFIEVEAKKFEKRRLQFGDIILEKSGGGPKQPVGRVALFDKDDGDFSFSNFTAALRVKDAVELDFRYLHKCLFWIYKSGVTEGMQSHSTGIRNLDGDAYKAIEIPVPPLPEQRRIVGVLDEAFAAIATAKANAEKNLQNAREIFESHLNEVFAKKGEGWVERRLGEICAFRNGINYTKESRGERIKIVGVRNFQLNFSVPLNDLDEVTIDGVLDDLDLLKPGDLLAVRSNGNVALIGRTLYVDKIAARTSHSGFTIRIRLASQNVLPKYLCYFMKSPRTRTRLADGGTGTNIKSLNQGMLSALEIPLPPNGVQKSIVAQLDALSAETQRLSAIYSRKLAALEELKQALLHQAFSGEL